MFTNPTGLAAVPPAGHPIIANWGEAVWDAIAFTGSGSQPFQQKDVVHALVADTPMAKRTALSAIGYFIRYAMAVPGDFYGPSSQITKIGPKTYRLADTDFPA